MTRPELLKIVIGRAHANGFNFRRWYTARLGVPWINTAAALALLESQRRYYALLFSHDFAVTFWKPGGEITFKLPASSYQRRMTDGRIATVKRKPFTRRTARPEAWRYHLRQMALAEEPLRYIRKYLNVEDDLADDPLEPLATTTPRAKRSKAPKKKKAPRPLPTTPPAFLLRPYPPRES